MAKKILIKPVISEKSELLTEQSEKYTFVVDKDANKLEIRQAVESFYNVIVTSVNTMVMPAKAKMRSTKRGYNTGRVSSFKKAIVTLEEGETIDIFGDI